MKAALARYRASRPLAFETVATVLITTCFLFVVVGEALLNGVLADDADIAVYYQSSDWLVGKGVLYREVFSEYPLLANLIFAVVRFLSMRLGGNDFRSFYITWVTLASICFIFAVSICLKAVGKYQFRNMSLLAWLLPSTLFFALLRYDIYPCLTTVFMMLSVRDKRYLSASIWMGVTIALKGYALFLLPAFFIHLRENRNGYYAIKASFLAVLPFLGSLAAIAVFAGEDGLFAPFKFHANRGFNPESTFQLFNYLFDRDLRATDIFPIPMILQIFFSLYPASRAPKSFERLQAGFGVSLLGFVTFSIFYSPQFILWILPVLSFSPHALTRALLLAYSIVTAGYLVVVGNPNKQSLIILVVLLVVTKISLLVSCLRDLNARDAEATGQKYSHPVVSE